MEQGFCLPLQGKDKQASQVRPLLSKPAKQYEQQSAVSQTKVWQQFDQKASGNCCDCCKVDGEGAESIRHE